MAKVVFQINYDVKPESREDYLDSIKQLHNHIINNSGMNYIVMEDKNRKNNFTEMYICGSMDEYENLEENMDDKTFELTTRLFNDFIIDKKANYSTFFEIE